jgi:hypothetical protein
MVILWGTDRPHTPDSPLKVDGPSQRITHGGEGVKEGGGDDDHREHGIAEVVIAVAASMSASPERPSA